MREILDLIWTDRRYGLAVLAIVFILLFAVPLLNFVQAEFFKRQQALFQIAFYILFFGFAVGYAKSKMFKKKK